MFVNIPSRHRVPTETLVAVSYQDEWRIGRTEPGCFQSIDFHCFTRSMTKEEATEVLKRLVPRFHGRRAAKYLAVAQSLSKGPARFIAMLAKNHITRGKKSEIHLFKL